MRPRWPALLMLVPSVALLMWIHVLARQSPDPDLIVDQPLMAAEWAVGWKYFPPGDCSIGEGCVLAAGLRKLLIFSIQTANISRGELILGDPTTSPYFEYSACHGHYHLLEFSDYRIGPPGGGNLVTSRKQDWCLIDVEQYLFEPWVPQVGFHDCDNQGLLPGWSDIYGAGLDCQWLDVTDIPPGGYELTAIVNSNGRISESDYSNNSAAVPVTVPDLSGDPDLVLDASRIATSLQVEQRHFPISHPAVADVCVGGYNTRRILRFDAMAANIGPFDFYLGDPAYQSQITHSAAHQHNHVAGFAEYQLFDLTGAPVTPARTPITWLPADNAPYLSAPWISPGVFYYAPTFTPVPWQGEPGIQRGWQALNPGMRDCQWVDVTSVPDGTYRLRATINPGGIFRESNVANNTVEVEITLPGIAHRPDGWLVPGAPLEVRAAPGGTRIIHDVSPATCPAANYNVYYGDAAPGSYSYSGAVCNVGASGDSIIPLPDPPPGGLLWFTIVGRDATHEGGHGFDSRGRQRPLTGAGFCGVGNTVTQVSCGAP